MATRATGGRFHRDEVSRLRLSAAMGEPLGVGPEFTSFKLLRFSETVRLTLELPRPRIHPGHGPAYDIRGQAIADPNTRA